jgi:hypothetical protein
MRNTKGLTAAVSLLLVLGIAGLASVGPDSDETAADHRLTEVARPLSTTSVAPSTTTEPPSTTTASPIVTTAPPTTAKPTPTTQHPSPTTVAPTTTIPRAGFDLVHATPPSKLWRARGTGCPETARVVVTLFDLVTSQVITTQSADPATVDGLWSVVLTIDAPGGKEVRPRCVSSATPETVLLEYTPQRTR